MMFHAFISYSSADKKRVSKIHNFLQQKFTDEKEDNALKIFRDETDLRPGSLTEEIKAALSDSRILVVCCSPNSVKSKWVSLEIDEFVLLGRKSEIILFVIKGNPRNVIPNVLQNSDLMILELRSGWLAGQPFLKARDNLLRAVSKISNIPLRAFIDWNLRNRQQIRRKVLRISISSALAVLAAGSFVTLQSPQKDWRPTDYSDLNRPVERIRLINNSEIEDVIIRGFTSWIANPSNDALLDNQSTFGKYSTNPSPS